MKLRTLVLSVCSLAFILSLSSCGKKENTEAMNKDSVMAAPPAPVPTAQPAPTQKSLYDRLGGKDAIKAVVDKFIGYVAADKRINKFFAKTNIDHLKMELVEQICAATGGPCKYTGKDMKTAHSGMKIKEAEFNALVEDLTKALDDFKVGQTEKDELLKALGSMKGDIVGQ